MSHIDTGIIIHYHLGRMADSETQLQAIGEVMKKLWYLWVRVGTRSPLILHFIYPLAVAGILRLVMYYAINVKPETIEAEAVLDLVIVGGAYIFFQWSQSWGLGLMLPLIRKIAEITLGRNREAMLAFATTGIGTVYRELAGLVSEEGIELEAPGLVLWVQRCFEHAKGCKYEGYDSNLPSQFLKRYTEYLEIHATSKPEVRKDTTDADSRTLIARAASVTEDLQKHRRDYEDFFSWHETHGVRLCWTDPDEAEKLRKRYKLPCTDIALWHGKYALLFDMVGPGKVRLWIRFDGDTGFDDCLEYIEELGNREQKLERHRGPAQVSAELAEAWVEYVAPQRRLETLGPFLLDKLGDYKEGSILDAAAGIGCESVFLICEGYGVTSNEIDPNLSRIALNYAAISDRRVTLDLQECYWQELVEQMPGGRRFDGVLVLGNSICLVLDEEQRHEAIKQFFDVLRPGGMLVIDERNFEYMIQNKNDIDQDHLRNFSCSWKVMYCGDKVRACPWEIDREGQRVLWRIYRNEPTVRNDHDIISARIDDMALHAFRKAELRGLLEQAGFKNIEEYSDFRPGYDVRCDFITYVCKKPVELEPGDIPF